jgi:hypothetical protein
MQAGRSILHSVSLVTAVVLAGCAKSGSGDAASNTISGTVTYKGAPVTGGLMKFIGGKGEAFHASLNPDGTYKCIGLKSGDYTVTIDTAAMKDAAASPEEMMNKMKKMAPPKQQQSNIPKVALPDPAKEAGTQPAKGTTGSGGYVPIPGKYANAKTSDLKVKYEGGNQTKNLELKD